MVRHQKYLLSKKKKKFFLTRWGELIDKQETADRNNICEHETTVRF